MGSTAYGRGGSKRQWLRGTAAVAVLLVAVTVLPNAVSGAEESAPPDADEESVELPTGLGVDTEEALASVAATAEDVVALRPGVSGTRIAVLSSGVDTGVLPESLRDQITVLGNEGDAVGYGTYVTSVLLQLLPDADVTSIGVYPDGRFQASWLNGGLQWIVDHADEFDAVLYAVQPSDFVDAVSAAMSTGWWEHLADLVAARPFAGAHGPVLGLALDNRLRSQQTEGMSMVDRWIFEWYDRNTLEWVLARARVQAIVGHGVPVVAAAGDLGPNPQTVVGLAGLEEVVTVGGYDGSGVSGASSSGPSLHGGLKPDLVAPTGIAGLLPEGSLLDRVLSARGLIDGTLEPEWDAGEPLTTARARLDSTLTSATVVAAAAAALSVEGLGDVGPQRGALTAAAVPIDGVPVWRQGAGVLQRVPDADFAASRPLATAHGDLGLEPAAAPWTTEVAVTGGTPTAASTTLADFLGVAPDATNSHRVLQSGDGPPVSASVTDGGVEISAPLGDGSYEGGIYCGYTELSLPTTGDALDPSLSLDGVPDDVEHVPTCLVQGTRLRAFGFYIHDIPAEDLTFALLPAIPGGQSLLDHTVTFLPANPLDVRLYSRVTGADGNADFPNIPPGYYRVRQFSDYGTPISQTVTDPGTGGEVTTESDIGEVAGYQSFDTLVLSSVCAEEVGEPFDTTGASRPCTAEFLEQTFGAENVRYEKATATWLVALGPPEAGTSLRVAFDFVRKMPGAVVSSRYIDLLHGDDFSFLELNLGEAIDPDALSEAAPAGDDGPFPPGSDPSEIVAELVSEDDLGELTALSSGIAVYPFNLTTPNYSGHISFNFSYDVRNATIVAAVIVGDSVAWGVVTPNGPAKLPGTEPGEPITLHGITAWGHGEGDANFEWKLLPKGASQGHLYLVFVPNGDTVVSSARVGDLSFALDTWTNGLWPGTTFADGRTGHTFGFDSNYSTRQMDDPECRHVDNGAAAADVCEDWAVMVHSPGDDAATFDVVDRATGASLIDGVRAAGGGFFDPRRGVHEFTEVLSFAGGDILAVEAVFRFTNGFRTNGRFWEQMLVPEDVLADYPDALTVLIEDDVAGRDSALLPHTLGPVPVAPYVPFRSTASLIDLTDDLGDTLPLDGTGDL